MGRPLVKRGRGHDCALSRAGETFKPPAEGSCPSPTPVLGNRQALHTTDKTGSFNGFWFSVKHKQGDYSCKNKRGGARLCTSCGVPRRWSKGKGLGALTEQRQRPRPLPPAQRGAGRPDIAGVPTRNGPRPCLLGTRTCTRWAATGHTRARAGRVPGLFRGPGAPAAPAAHPAPSLLQTCSLNPP